jgi:thymidylate kinase
MAAVALIGPDGAGKTTLTRMLECSSLLPFRYLYMGINIEASNRALLTSRLAHYIKGRGRPAADRQVECTSVSYDAALPARGGGRLRGAARLTNRLIDEWYRQLVSWSYQLRGFTVLYDRHFVFDFAPEIAASASESLDRRLHRWFLRYLYPRPDLVIFLDAPGELLFARKGELTVAELERRRQAFLRVGQRMPCFVRVDATRPLAEVYADVANRVVEFCRSARQYQVVQEVAG